MPEQQSRGYLFGASAYLIWGLFPLYWPLLEPAGAFEILAHRIAWSMVTVFAVLVLVRRLRGVGALLRNRRQALLLAVAAVTITANWAMYIWAVNNNHVVEASLGYFINPLVTVLMGVLILSERLRTLQWVAVGIAGVAVLVLTLGYGRVPWVALVLACSFGSYGLAKKKANAGALESLAVETMLITPIALAYIGYLVATGGNHFATEGTGHALIFVSTGIVTAVPLVCFSAAATRIPMVGLGLLQYVTPVVQFSLGVLLFGEQMPPVRWAGFVLVWIALALFTFESLGHRRRQLRQAAEASAI